MILPARSARCLLLALGPLLGCASAPPAPQLVAAPPAVQPVPVAPALLEKGIPVEREIREGETHEYRIAVNAGDYARVRVDQTKVDVAVRLVGPGGEEVATADGVGGRKAPELLSWIAAQAGEFRSVVTSRGTGTYKMTLQELRPAVAGDVQRVLADRVMNDAEHWLSREDLEAKQKALAKYEEALALWQAAGDGPMEGRALNQIGEIHRGLGDRDKATACYQRALDLARGLGDRRGEAESIHNLGVMRHELGQSPQGLQDVRQALQLWEELEDQEGIAIASFSLGVIQWRLGQTDDALVSLNRALELRQAHPSGVPLVLVALGSVFRKRGEGDRALEMYQQALQESQQAEDQLGKAYALQEMAIVFLRRGELQRALEHFTEALGIQRLLGNRGQEGWELSYLGTTAMYLGDLNRALAFYRQALEIQNELRETTWQAASLSNIGWIHYRLGEPEEALKHYERSFELSKAASDSRGQAMALYGMSVSQIALGKSAEGVRLLQEAIAFYQQAGGDPLGEINAFLELGRAYRIMGATQQAADYFQRALEISRRNKTLMSEAVSLSAVARLESDRGNLALAASAMEEAIQILESIRPKVAAQRQRVAFFASRRDYYDFYVDLQMRLHEREPAGGHLAAALATSERAKARALLDLLAEGRIHLESGISAEMKQREEEIGNRISLLQGDLLDDLARGRNPSSEIESQLDLAEEESERIEWEIRREHPHYAAARNPAPLPPQRIQDLLDEQTAFLEYAVGQDASYLFVLTRQSLEGYRLPGASELGELAESLREAIQLPGRRQVHRFVGAARRLYQILIEPAAEALRGKTNLIIAPDGPLLMLSFETLLTTPPAETEQPSFAELPYLIRDKSIAYVPSASVLAELVGPSRTAAAPAGSDLFLGFADPAHAHLSAATAGTGESPAVRLLHEVDLLSAKRLPYSRKELLEIGSLFPPGKARLYFDDQASEENVKANLDLQRARWIHFAVHGFVDETRPELSGLLLSLDADRKEDGLLQVHEIFNLNFAAELVVLSACDTALGKNVRGEGLLGLSRALLYAGAASIAVSLWQVADESTAELMVRFYRHLNGRSSRAEALRASKLEMLQDGRHAHPYYWAAFILMGDPGASVTPGSVARQ